MISLVSIVKRAKHRMRFTDAQRQKAEKTLQYAVLVLASLYVVNAVGGIDGMTGFLRGRRYLNVLWIALGLYLVVSRGKADWYFFWRHARLIIPVFVVGLFLNFYHETGFDLAYFKYAFLLTVACSVVCTVEGYELRQFFLINAISCLALFLVAIYQICALDYLVPNAAGNQNILASISLIIGNISIFSILYKQPNRTEKFFYLLCGVLAIWVAFRTSCRTAYVSEMISTFVFLFWGRKHLHWSQRKVVLIFICAVLMMLATVLSSPAVTGDKFRAILNEIQSFLDLREGQTTAGSVGLRLAMWKAAFINVIPNNLCFGVGDFRQIYWPKLIVGSSIDREFLETLYHFHNEGINTLVMGGLLLFSVCGWLLYRFFCLARTEPVLLSILVGTLSWGMTEVALFHKVFFFVFVSVWLLYSCAIQNENKEKIVTRTVKM